MQKICKNCGHNFFKIDIKEECSNCTHNGAFENEEENTSTYIYDEKRIEDDNLQRTQAEDESECRIGASNDVGCHLYICQNCGNETNLPFSNF